jgi:eukaryotic-like serine/threonine-protein kinase
MGPDSMISGTEDTAQQGGDTPLDAVPVTAGLVRGHAIGRYLVLDRLGAGGMGVVYAAYDPELDRKIAVKLLHARSGAPNQARARGKLMNRLFGDPTPDESTGGPRADDRLLREAQAMARVSHPNVIAVHDVGEHGGQVFVAMEFIQGQTLAAWLKRSARSWSTVIDVMLRAGHGVAAAHDKGLVHRDFKPDNVMIGDPKAHAHDHGGAPAFGRVVVMDFGLVQPAKDDDTVTLDELRPTTDALRTDLTVTGMVLGTPAYMSPEQHLGRRVDARSDQFSFCVALWEGVYGERPFVGDSLAALAAAVIEGKRRPPPAGTKVPAHVRRVLERGLAVEPRDRFATMDALLHELARDPRRRQRRLLGAGTVLALVGVAFGVRQIDRARALAACDAEGRAIEDVWNDDARRRVETALLATGVPNAATTFAKVTPWLDRHAEAWARARTDACAADVRGATMPDAPIDATRECLDGQADSVTQLVALLEEADAMMVRKAVALAASLPGVERCTDPRWLARRGPPPEPAERELARQLTRATALEAAGKFAEALSLAQQVLATAETLGDEALTARVRYRIGALHEDLGDYAAAERELTAAVFGSAQVGEDGDAADAAMRLAVVVSARLGRQAEGATWARWAEVLVERLGEEADVRGARMHNELGVMARDRGAIAEARAHHERALELKRELHGEGHPEVAISFNNLGTVLVDLGLYDEGLAHYERATEISEATLGPDHQEVALSVLNEAEVYWRREDFPQALARIERALAINEAAFGPEHPRVAQTLQNLGLVLHTMEREDEAAQHLRRAIAIFERVLGRDHLQVANALSNLADVQRELGEVELARANHERALAIDEQQLGPDNAELAPVLHGLGNDSRALGRHREALAYFERALAVLERLGAEHPHVGITLLAIAETQLDLGHVEAARATAERAQALLERIDAPAKQREMAKALLARARAAQ